MRRVKAALWRKIARRSEKIAKTFGSVENNAYLCTRICRNALGCLDLRSSHQSLERADASIALFSLKVPWMSGLVYGLQNRPRRFESARHLANKKAEGFLLQLFLFYSDNSYAGMGRMLLQVLVECHGFEHDFFMDH